MVKSAERSKKYSSLNGFHFIANVGVWKIKKREIRSLPTFSKNRYSLINKNRNCFICYHVRAKLCRENFDNTEMSANAVFIVHLALLKSEQLVSISCAVIYHCSGKLTNACCLSLSV